jgi:hypothetical protein
MTRKYFYVKNILGAEFCESENLGLKNSPKKFKANLIFFPFLNFYKVSLPTTQKLSIFTHLSKGKSPFFISLLFASTQRYPLMPQHMFTVKPLQIFHEGDGGGIHISFFSFSHD